MILAVFDLKNNADGVNRCLLNFKSNLNRYSQNTQEHKSLEFMIRRSYVILLTYYTALLSQ